jgi:hypothetical protein
MEPLSAAAWRLPRAAIGLHNRLPVGLENGLSVLSHHSLRGEALKVKVRRPIDD